MSEQFVVHCHIPKTGGSALNRRILFARYGEDRVQLMYRFIFERSSRLPIRHRTKTMRCFAAAGHVPFGYVDKIYPDALYISVFRDPVERFMSFLNFMIVTPDHAARGRIPDDIIDEACCDPDRLVSAVLSDRHLCAVHSNTQVRLASGTARLAKSRICADHLAAALINLRNQRYLAERHENLEGFLIRLDGILPGRGHTISGEGIPAALEKRRNRKITSQMLSARSITDIRTANALDLRMMDALDKPELKVHQQVA